MLALYQSALKRKALTPAGADPVGVLSVLVLIGTLSISCYTLSVTCSKPIVLNLGQNRYWVTSIHSVMKAQKLLFSAVCKCVAFHDSPVGISGQLPRLIGAAPSIKHQVLSDCILQSIAKSGLSGACPVGCTAFQGIPAALPAGSNTAAPRAV